MATSIDDNPTRHHRVYEKNFPPQVATRYFISLLLELLLFVLIRSFALTPALSSAELLSANQQQMLNQNNKRSFSRWIQKHRWEREEKTFLIAFLALLLLRLDSLSPTLKKFQLFLQSIKSILAYYTFPREWSEQVSFSLAKHKWKDWLWIITISRFLWKCVRGS